MIETKLADRAAIANSELPRAGMAGHGSNERALLGKVALWQAEDVPPYQ